MPSHDKGNCTATRSLYVELIAHREERRGDTEANGVSHVLPRLNRGQCVDMYRSFYAVSIRYGNIRSGLGRCCGNVDVIRLGRLFVGEGGFCVCERRGVVCALCGGVGGVRCRLCVGDLVLCLSYLCVNGKKRHNERIILVRAFDVGKGEGRRFQIKML